MADNDRIILDNVLEQKQKEIAPDYTSSRFFELFVAEQILKDYDLSYDEIESGIVDGGGDGGIDGFYVFVNGELIQESPITYNLRKDIHIEVILFQSKVSASFSDLAVDRLASSVEELFDLSRTIESLAPAYNTELLSSTKRFRDVYTAYAAKFPKLTINLYYATKGDSVHPNVSRKEERVKNVIKHLFSSGIYSFKFLTARDLLELARQKPTVTYELRLTENSIASAEKVFICLASLSDFHRFITDDNGKLIRHIFEANVRDYQGKTQVNQQIQDTLVNPSAEDFWWLNNGVTIVATDANQGGKSITIENPEIVNGLQTSTEIHSYFSSGNIDDKGRNVLVRVIVPKTAESRDRIIKATNSQTPMPPASLRATDPIHRDIENYLKSYGLYYDRRKNYYKNEGQPISQIISIPHMAQAVMSIVLQRPDSARARPSTLLKEDTEYEKLFNNRYDIKLYRACVDVLKQTEAFLSQHPASLSATVRNNLKFYVAMVATQIALKCSDPTPASLATLAGRSLPSECLHSAFIFVKTEYDYLGATDQVAKGTDLKAAIGKKIRAKYPISGAHVTS